MKRLIQWLLDLIYPPKCTFCRKLLRADETDICGKCRTTLPQIEGSLKRGEFYSECFSVYYYDETVRESLHRFKFQSMQQYAAVYGRLIAMKILKEGLSFDVLTWVPISKKRRAERGYDQSELIAKAIAKELAVPCIATLQKTRHNLAQSLQPNAAARKANVLGAYSIASSLDLTDKQILLIDDIMTTGATLSECSRVLLTAGAKNVCCATMAAVRGEPGKNNSR